MAGVRHPLEDMAGVRIVRPNNDDTNTSAEDFRTLQKVEMSDQENNRGARDPNNIGAQVIPVTAGLDDELIVTAHVVDTATLLPEDSIGMAYPVPEDSVDHMPAIVALAATAQDPDATMRELREMALKRRLITPLEADILQACAQVQCNEFIGSDRARVLEGRLRRAMKHKKSWSWVGDSKLSDSERLFCVIADAMRYNILSEMVSCGARVGYGN